MDSVTKTVTNLSNLNDVSLGIYPNELAIEGTIMNTVNSNLDYTINFPQMPAEFITKGKICMKETIVDINVIVPNKVVEITFEDGKKEKMICHKNDTFDLRRCCFIAIAKHLYKEEYTFEGIEYMAEQLMYQKKYVKIVSDALKDYRRKEAEKEKELREEEEAKIIRDRQRLKRRKKKEERAQRHREILVDLIADSINEAKVRRKDNK